MDPIPAPQEAPVPVRVRFLAWLGLAGFTQFLVAVVALHAAALPNEPWHMSEFAHSRLWWVWVGGAYGLVVGGIAFTLALKEILPTRSPLARAALALLGLSSLALLLVATFPVDTDGHVSTVGTIHNDAALGAFGSVAGSMLLVVPDLRARQAWRPFADASLVLGLLVAGFAAAYVLADMRASVWIALVQRVLVGLVAAWFIGLGLQLLKIPATAKQSAAPA